MLIIGDTSIALGLLKGILEVNTDEILVNRFHEISLAFSEYEQQIDFFKELVKKNKENAHCHYGLAMAYIYEIQQNPGPNAGILAGVAIEELNKAIAIDSFHWSAHYALAMTYFHMPSQFNLNQQSIEIFVKLISIQERTDTLFPQYTLTYLFLGDAYMKDERYDEAIAVWEKGLELYPDESEFKLRLRHQ